MQGKKHYNGTVGGDPSVKTNAQTGEAPPEPTQINDAFVPVKTVDSIFFV